MNTKDDSTLLSQLYLLFNSQKSENENNSNDIPRPAAMLSCKSLGRIYAPIRVAHEVCDWCIFIFLVSFLVQRDFFSPLLLWMWSWFFLVSSDFGNCGFSDVREEPRDFKKARSSSACRNESKARPPHMLFFSEPDCSFPPVKKIRR